MKMTFPRLIILLALLAMLVPSCACAITGQELAALRGQRSYPQALDLPDVQAMALEHVGDVSEPFATSLGIHIVEYASDAKGGAVALTQEQRESMAKAALLEEKYQILQDRLKIWQKDYDIETQPELIALPENLS